MELKTASAPANRVIRVFVLLILASLIAGACSSGDEDSSGSGNNRANTSSTSEAGTNGSDVDQTGEGDDPCSLLTVDDLQTATGVSFDEGTVNEAMSNGETAICDWIASGDEFATAQVLIVGGGGDNLDSQEEGAQEMSNTTHIDVSGVDAAYRTEEGSIVGMRIGDDFVQVSYLPAGPGDVGDATIQLAQTVAANLGAS